MRMKLLVFLCLFRHAFAGKPPDVDCLVIHLEYVSCMWNQEGPPEVNYTFFNWFYDEERRECNTYITENNVNVGCRRPLNSSQRFGNFNTQLLHDEHIHPQIHWLKQKVLLNPPTNLTVLNGSDQNLWFYWNQTRNICVESRIRYRKNNKEWLSDPVSSGLQRYCINLPSHNSLYELQVQSRVGSNCGESLFWSDWSEPVFWGSNNSTALSQMSVWTPVFYVVGVLTLIVLGAMLLHIERFRVILIPIVPKPILIPDDIKDLSQIFKGLKESSKSNYNEHACPVREYCQVSQSDSETSGSSTCSAATDQTNCSGSNSENGAEDPSTALSSASTVACEEEKLQESV